MRLALLALLVTLTPAAWASKAHEHGVAHVDIAVDAARLTIALSTPLDNLVGFERAPRTDAERRALEAAVARLADAALWQPDAAARCKAGSPKVTPPAFDKVKGNPAKADEHADVEASVEFECAKPQELRSLGTQLFKALPRLKRAEVQVATSRGQAKAVLLPSSAVIVLPR